MKPLLLRWLWALNVILLGAWPLAAQQPAAPPDAGVYQALKGFALGGESATVDNVVLKRDRAQITFTSGKLYFEPPVAGRVRGAVFIGSGTFRAEPPPSAFELDNLKRMLKADVVESDFETAVLRFTDDTYDVIKGSAAAAGAASPEAQKLASEFNPRMLKETGANMAARASVSILNDENPGFFVAEFDKGKRGRFSLLLDFQGRLPTSVFDVNGGEKGMVFAYRNFNPDIWMAFYSLQDYERRVVEYSDTFDLIHIKNQTMEIDLRDPKKMLKYSTRMDIESRRNGLRAIPFAVNEGLGEYDNVRLKKAVRLKSLKLAGDKPVTGLQEDWDGGLTVILSEPLNAGQKATLVMEFEGDFIYNTQFVPDCHYPLSNESWYPRHGYLNRSTYDLTFYHQKKHRVASMGARVREDVAADQRITQWKMDKPIALITFAMGPFQMHSDTLKRKEGNLPVEYYSLPGSMAAIKEDFIVAELMNSVNYFNAIFGVYPYSRFGAVLFPFGYGQGFPTMLLIPATDRASKYTYSFIAHETAHQWWGNIVAWRSYRDQWLSEGFAEYSGVLYTGLRDKLSARRDLLDDMRRSLKDPPVTETGIGRGRLVDVGPIILGQRLITRETSGAYQALIYNKGGLVLRMLHFLFTDPGTGDGQPFFDMMTDFVKRHRDGWASTDSFRQVANEHFARTPVARKFGLKNLDWFFSQWVYQTHLPTYRLDYKVENQPDGSVLLQGTVFQDNAPENWFMPLPLVVTFGKDQYARGTVHAAGPKAPFQLKLPRRPSKVELDPDFWVLSEKTSSREYR